MGMPMPCAPRSPRPRMREPSVTTITWTASWFQLKHLGGWTRGGPRVTKGVQRRVLRMCCGCAAGACCTHGGEEAAILAREVHAAAATELVAELLAHVPHGGRVDEGGQLLHVVNQHPVVQRLVAVVQVLQVEVLPDGGLVVVALRADVVHHPRRLSGCQKGVC